MDFVGDMFKFIVDYVINIFVKFNIMGMDKVYVMMVDRYYCQNNLKIGKFYVYWMLDEKLKILCEDIKIKKYLVVGVVFFNILLCDIMDVNWKNFYFLKLDYIILYFWDLDCGYCKKIILKFQMFYVEKLKVCNVEVFVVGKVMGDDFEKWKKYICDNKFIFINVGFIELFYKVVLEDVCQFILKYMNIELLNYYDIYDIYVILCVMVFDKDKKIVVKQLSIL